MILPGCVTGARRIYRLPEINRLAKKRGEAGRHYAHNRGNNSCIAIGESFAKDVGIAVEASFPERVTDDYRLSELLHFVSGKNSAADRLHAQKTEEVWRDVLYADGFGAVGTREQRRLVPTGKGNIFEDIILFLPVQKFCNRRRLALLGVRERNLPDGYHSVGVRVGKRTIEQGVHDRENCRICADAEGEGKDDNCYKTGRLEQRAKCETKILQQGFKKRQAARFAVLFLGLLRAAEAYARLALGIAWGHAVLEIFFNGELEMRSHFRIEVTVKWRGTDESTEAKKRFAEGEGH